MADLLTELQRQRDELASLLASATQQASDTQAQLDQLDSVIADMTRTDDAAALYASVQSDRTGVSVRSTAKRDRVPAPPVTPAPPAA